MPCSLCLNGRQPVTHAPAFVSAAPLHLNAARPACKVARRPRSTPQCAATKLLVVDLQELVRSSAPEQIRSFSERVEVDRSSSKDTTFVLFSSQSGYAASMQSIKDASLVEPDALATLDGSELYQRQYRTPDPYWAQTVQRDWEPKPVEWVLGQFFGEDVEDLRNEEVAVHGTVKEGGDTGDVCTRVGMKLAEMGLRARVNAGEHSGEIVVTAAAGSVAEVVGFCQMMLKIEESGTFVFGGDEFVSSCVRGTGNVGLCGAGSRERWDVLGNRVFVSKEVGVKALLDGVVHHAVF